MKLFTRLSTRTAAAVVTFLRFLHDEGRLQEISPRLSSIRRRQVNSLTFPDGAGLHILPGTLAYTPFGNSSTRIGQGLARCRSPAGA